MKWCYISIFPARRKKSDWILLRGQDGYYMTRKSRLYLFVRLLWSGKWRWIEAIFRYWSFSKPDIYIPILITTYLAYHFKSRPVMGVTTGLVFLSLLGEFIYRACIILKCNLHHYQLVADDSHEISRLICSLRSFRTLCPFACWVILHADKWLFSKCSLTLSECQTIWVLIGVQLSAVRQKSPVATSKWILNGPGKKKLTCRLLITFASSLDPDDTL